MSPPCFPLRDPVFASPINLSSISLDTQHKLPPTGSTRSGRTDFANPPSPSSLRVLSILPASRGIAVSRQGSLDSTSQQSAKLFHERHQLQSLPTREYEETYRVKEEIWKLHSRCAVRSVGKWVRETRRSEEWSCLRYSDAPGELRRFGAAIRRKQRGRREKLFGREENSFQRRTNG